MKRVTKVTALALLASESHAKHHYVEGTIQRAGHPIVLWEPNRKSMLTSKPHAPHTEIWKIQWSHLRFSEMTSWFKLNH